MNSQEFNYTELWKEIIQTYTYSNIARKILKVVQMSTGTHLEVDIQTPDLAVYVAGEGEVPRMVSGSKVTVRPYKIAQQVGFSDEAVEDSQLGRIKLETLKAIDGIYMKEDKDVITCFFYGAGSQIAWHGDFSGTFPQPLLEDYMIQAIFQLETNFLKPTHILMSPDIAQELRMREELKKKLETYATEVIVTPFLPNLCVLVIDANAAGMLVVREDKNYVEYKKPQTGLTGAIAYERVVPVITNSTAIIRVCNDSATPTA